MSLKNNLLIVEDDCGVLSLLMKALKDYQPIYSQNLQSAKNIILQQNLDLILLDWNLPDGNGIDLLPIINQQSPKPAVLILTARSTEKDIIEGLNKGADDYLTKPFSLTVLNARINALLRRSVTKKPAEQEDFLLNNEEHKITYQNQEIYLYRREFALLKVFLQNRCKVLSRDQLLDLAWGNDCNVSDRAVDVSIRRLRQAFEKHNFILPITTLRGIGYRLEKTKQN